MLRKRIVCLTIAALTFAATVPLTAGNSVNAATKTISKGELITNTSFKGGWALPWSVSNTAPGDYDFEVRDGAYDLIVKDPGVNKWDVMLTYPGVRFEQGHTYKITIKVKAEKDCKIYPKIGRNAGDYKEFWNNNWNDYELKAGEEKEITASYTMNDPTENDLAFQIQAGGSLKAESSPYKLTFTKLSVEDDQFKGYEVDYNENGYAVRTNQIGYFTNGEKTATAVIDDKDAVVWKLLDSKGNIATSGMTKVFGMDEASGDFVHKIDFSNYKVSGKGYKLVVGTDKLVPEYNPVIGVDLKMVAESPSFDIQDNIYSKLKYDAFKYFYHNRSAMPIEAKYTDGRDDLARPAGHTKELLKCSPSDEWYKPYGTYELDVTGGWYDAGDHGKYVVNGGISTWTLQNQYERALNRGEDLTQAPYGDNTMNIPESGNGILDILDESRFNLEFMLKMQVPEGKEFAGMVHHCAHDETWTGLGMRPDEDDRVRYIYAPTTAATLNLSATAAQGARIWGKYDSKFAAKCLEAAEKAWDAAIKNPNIYAPKTSVGGGTYDDDHVEDEFYWAVCELYAATGNQKYLDFMKTSKYYLDMPDVATDEETGAFNWANVEALGTLTLLSSKNNLGAEEIKKAEENVLKSADSYIDVENETGYSVALEDRDYVWASNGNLANIMMVMAYANDIGGKTTTKYIDGANKSMDYLLGVNPNTKCYVSGYGVNPLLNPHHRFWSHEVNDKFPRCPAGVLSGGPNHGMDDPYVKGAGWKAGSKPSAKCYLDDIQSYSTNECTINWNAPLAWMASYLDSNSNGVLKGDSQDNKYQEPAVTNPTVEDKSNENSKEDKKDSAIKNKSVKTGDSGALLSLILCGISAGAAFGFKKKK